MHQARLILTQKMMSLTMNNNTYNYIFRYIDSNNSWECFHRDDYNNYWNNKKSIQLGIGKSPNQALNDLLSIESPDYETRWDTEWAISPI